MIQTNNFSSLTGILKRVLASFPGLVRSSLAVRKFVQKGNRSSRDVCHRSVFTSADNVCESEFRTASDECARPGNEASTIYIYFSISVSILGISVVSNCSN